MKNKSFISIKIILLLFGSIPLLSFRHTDTRTPLEVIVQITGTPPLPFPAGIVVNINTGEEEVGTLLATDVVIQAKSGDVIAVDIIGATPLEKIPVTAAEIAAGVKYINLASAL